MNLSMLAAEEGEGEGAKRGFAVCGECDGIEGLKGFVEVLLDACFGQLAYTYFII